jgi:uncharacterized protein (TIGR00369 family)
MDERQYGLVEREALLSESGIDFLRGMIAGRHPHPPICKVIGFHFIAAEPGRIVLEALPELRHYNPIGTVHGGFHATLLDTASGAAIFTLLAKGESWTTLELKLNFVRPITQNTGPMRAEGRVIHRGRTVATSEGDLKDASGQLYAHATTTCMIFPAKA